MKKKSKIYNLASLFTPDPEKYDFEVIKNIYGTTFINDSKSVNLNKTWFSLEKLEEGKNSILVLGDADVDFSVIRDLVIKKIRVIVCYGQTNFFIQDQLSKYVDMIITESRMEEIVRLFYKSKQTILFSPGCVSYGMFENSDERGAQFEIKLNQLR